MRLLPALVLVGLLYAMSARAAAPGAAAPPFALATAGGETVSLAPLHGRVVYVDFWASWCAPCRRSFPWMNDLQARYGKDGLAIVGINVDKRREDAARFLRDTPASFTIVFDATGVTPAAYDVKGMPSSYLIDRNGNVVAVEEGFHDERRPEIEARIRALLAQH
ncbi:MAG TPA: TlpA disulfide reductase family protein [Casimicrobiaceae bacterium]|nr:TlpA disulfide reductase family protein [Casimicrobiaceae bacterium]